MADVTDSVDHQDGRLLTRHDAERSDIVTLTEVRERSVAAHVPEYTSGPKPGRSASSFPVASAVDASTPLVKGTTLETAAEDGDELAKARREVERLQSRVQDLEKQLTVIHALSADAQAS